MNDAGTGMRSTLIVVTLPIRNPTPHQRLRECWIVD